MLEVMPFKSIYHVIFVPPAYHQFHARPCYIYNNLKMPGPNGVITVSGNFKKSQESELGEAAFAEVVLYGEELKDIQSKRDPTEMPTSRKQIIDSAPAFKAANDTKPVELVEGNSSKITTIGTSLDPK
jgi:hypothetical protein